MDLGLAIGGNRRVGHPGDQLLREYVELAHAADACGFKYIEAGAHFLSDAYIYVQNVPLLARLAPETGAMKLVLVLPLPFLHPVQAAESVAALDTLSGGRVVASVALGYREEEGQVFGVKRSERVSRMLEALEIMKLLWSRDGVHFQGRFWSLQGATSGLKPAQRPYPPVWLATSVAPGVRRAARLGLSWHADSSLPSSSLGPLAKAYWDQWSEAGHKGDGQVVLQRSGYLAGSKAEAVEYLARQLAARRQVLHPPSVDSLENPHPNVSEQIEATCIAGTPGQAVDQLQDLRARTRAGLVLLRVHWPDMTLAEMVRQVQLLGKHVVPRI